MIRSASSPPPASASTQCRRGTLSRLTCTSHHTFSEDRPCEVSHTRLELSAEAVDKSAIALLARLIGWFILQRLLVKVSSGEGPTVSVPSWKKKKKRESESGLNRENPAHH